MDGSNLRGNELFDYSGDLSIESVIVADWFGSDINASTEIMPDEYTLSAAYPNPFNPVTNLSYSLPKDENVRLDIYNIQGQVVETLVNDYIVAGYHSVIWNADAHASGVYFVKMIAGAEYIHTQKLMLVK